MSLKNRQTVTIPLSNGVDTSQDPKTTSFEHLAVARNCSYQKLGAVNKRNGYRRMPPELLTDQSIMSSSFGLHSLDDALLNSDGQELFSYVSSRGKWHSLGNAPHVFTDNRTVSMTGLDQRNPVSVVVDAMTWIAYEQDGGVSLVVRDNQSKQNVINDVLVASDANRPVLFSFDGEPVLVFSKDDGISGPALNVCKVQLNKVLNGNFTPEVTIAGQDTNRNYDVAVVSDGFIIAFSSAGGTNLAKVEPHQSVFLLVALTVTAQGSDVALVVDTQPLTDDVMVTSLDSSGQLWFSKVSGVDATVSLGPSIIALNLGSNALDDPNPSSGQMFSVLSGPDRFVSGTITTPERVCQLVGSGTSTVLFQASQIVYRTVLNTALGTATDCEVLSVNADMVSKPFSLLGYSQVALNLSSSFQLSHLTVDINNGSDLSRSNVLASGPRTTSTLANHDGTQLVLERSAQFPTEDTSTIAGIGAFGVSALQLNSQTQQSIKFHANLHIPGAIMRSTDGSQVFEDGFLQEPVIDQIRVLTPGEFGISGSVAKSANGGSGTYVYAFTYEWTDAKKQVHESAPSVLKTVQIPEDGCSVAFLVSPLSHTSRRKVRLVGYRSLERLGDTSASTPLLRFTSVTNPVISIKNSLGNVVVDSNSDDDIRSNRPLYTVANERGNDTRENTPPPPCSSVAVYGNRMFVLSTDDDDSIFYSKTSVTGEPVNFTSDDFSITVQDDDNENVTALSANETNLIIYKPTRISHINGRGPTNQGEDNDFGDPVVISSDVGCDQPSSIAIVAQGDGGLSGIVFKSRQGFYLLDGGLNTQYIGGPVRDFDSLNVVKAVHVPTSDQIRFLTDSDSAVIFNYRLNQWSTWTNHIAVDGVMVDEQFYYSKPSGVILAETLGEFDDDGEPISLYVETPPVSLAGLSGYVRLDRLWLIGERKGPHTLKMQVAFDNDPSFDPDWIEEFDVDDALSTPEFEEGQEIDFDQPFNQYEFGMQGGKRCRAFKVSIEDVQPRDQEPNEGMSLTALTVQFRTERMSFNRLNPKQRGE